MQNISLHVFQIQNRMYFERILYENGKRVHKHNFVLVITFLINK